MDNASQLLKNFARHMALPWRQGLSPQERVWFAVYPPAEERRIRMRLGLFAEAARNAGHGWQEVDLTDRFGEWMADQEYRDAYFQSPGDLDSALEEFRSETEQQVRDALSLTGEGDVAALAGLPYLFGFMSISALVEAVAPSCRGRLLVFFPGDHEGSVYRFLGARDGWSYLAVPIGCEEGWR